MLSFHHSETLRTRTQARQRQLTRTRGTHTLTSTVLTIMAGAMVFAMPPAVAQGSLEVPQGSVGRWVGEGTERCGMDGKMWGAVDGACYYPVDVDRAPGRIEIARWRNAGSIETAWLDITAKDYGDQDIDFPDESYVHISEEDLARHYSEQSEIKPLFRRRPGDARFTLPLGPPADPLPEGKYFGVRRTFNGEPKGRHTGTDYAIGLGNPGLAVADGTVLLTGEHFFAGRSVYIDHGNGLISMLFHLEEISVEAGQEVSRGDTIAKIGSTGRSTGPHLHLGMRWLGARIDPDAVLGDPSSLPTLGGTP